MEALADPDHEEHNDIVEWMAQVHDLTDFDPGFFDPAEADERLSHLRV